MKPLPPAFVAGLPALVGDAAADLAAALDRPPVRAARANRLKVDARPPGEPVPWCPDASYLDGPADPLAVAAGLVYVQEPSAMAVVEALGVRPGDVVLDVAASPGGKATHLAAKVGSEGVLVANEVGRSRLGPLLENLERWGHPQTAITSVDVDALVSATGPRFDRVVLDAPCSGEAMFRKDAAAREQWSPAHVEGSARRQRRLLDAAARAVRPGGALAYSTCTFNRTEDEDVVDAFLAGHEGWRLERVERLWPHRDRADGHFVAVLAAPAGDDEDGGRRPPRRPSRPPALPPLLAGLDPERVVERRGSLYLVRPVDLGLPDAVLPGLHLGQVRPDRFEPSHALALSTVPLDVPHEALDDEDARRFLAGEVLDLPGDAGWTRVGWGEHPLGWAKRVGGRLKPKLPARARLRRSG